jgi:O-antigen/teichoic acid export membrane protein
MMNGLLLFLGSQGDRLLIGKQIGLAELGHYSAALLLIYYPTGMIQRYMTTMHLPLLAGAESKTSKLAAADRLAGQTLLLTVIMAAGYAAVAPVMIVLLYGEQFRQPALLVAAIGILQASRFIRLWPVTIALAEGRSGLVLISNLVRLLAFPGAFLGAELVGGIFGILLAFAAAEALALIVTVVMVSRHLAVSLQGGFSRIAAFALCSAVILGWAAAVGQRVSSGAVVALVAGSLLLVAWLIRSEKRTVSEAMRMLRPAAR